MHISNFINALALVSAKRETQNATHCCRLAGLHYYSRCCIRFGVLRFVRDNLIQVSRVQRRRRAMFSPIAIHFVIPFLFLFATCCCDRFFSFVLLCVRVCVAAARARCSPFTAANNVSSFVVLYLIFSCVCVRKERMKFVNLSRYSSYHSDCASAKQKKTLKKAQLSIDAYFHTLHCAALSPTLSLSLFPAIHLGSDFDVVAVVGRGLRAIFAAVFLMRPTAACCTRVRFAQSTSPVYLRI